jgi:hypothetical protein
MGTYEPSWLDRTRAIPYSISTLIPAPKRFPVWAGLLIATLGFGLLGGLVALTVVAFTQREPAALAAAQPFAAAPVEAVATPAAPATVAVQAASAPAAAERSAPEVRRTKKHRAAKRHVAAKRAPAARQTTVAKSSARKRGNDDEIAKLLRGL